MTSGHRPRTIPRGTPRGQKHLLCLPSWGVANTSMVSHAELHGAQPAWCPPYSGRQEAKQWENGPKPPEHPTWRERDSVPRGFGNAAMNRRGAVHREIRSPRLARLTRGVGEVEKHAAHCMWWWHSLVRGAFTGPPKRPHRTEADRIPDAPTDGATDRSVGSDQSPSRGGLPPLRRRRRRRSKKEEGKKDKKKRTINGFLPRTTAAASSSSKRYSVNFYPQKTFSKRYRVEGVGSRRSFGS